MSLIDSELPAELRAGYTPPTDASEALNEKIIYPDPEIERDVYEHPSDTNPNVSTQPFMQNDEFMELLNRMQQGSSDPNGLAFGASMFQMGNRPFPTQSTQPQPPKVPDTKLTKFLKTKIHIGLLAILTYFCIASDYSSNVFLTFLVWETIEMFFLKQYEQQTGGILSLIFMFSGIPPSRLNVILKWIYIINRILKDVTVFLFAFVLTHCCFGSPRFQPVDIIATHSNYDDSYDINEEF